MRQLGDRVMERVRLSLFLSLVLVVPAASAQDADQQTEPPAVVPADMGPGANPWNGLIRFPKGAEDVSVFVKCQGVITINGHIHDSRCFTDASDHWAYTTALDRVLGSARVEPATVDGRPREVLTVFSFLFLRKQQKETIILFQNDMSNRDEYGLAYVAPQLYSFPSSSCKCKANRRYFRRYIVDVDGTAEIDLPPDLDRCQMCWSSHVAEMKFIPGHVNGKFVQTAMDVLDEQE
jgi:hypothetical protein